MISNDRKSEILVSGGSAQVYLQSYLLSAYGSGREALLALFASKHLEGTTIMVPGFLPQGIVAPLTYLHCNLVFYRTDSYGNPDFEHIAKLFDDSPPSVFFLLHYFGVRRKSDRLAEFFRRYQALVIEDFAQSFPDEDYIVNAPGNIFLVSLPKLFGIPDGGLIFGSNQQMTPQSTRRGIGGRTYTAFRRLSLRFARPEAFGFLDKCARYVSAVFSILSYRVLMKSFTKPSAQSRYSSDKFRRTDISRALATRKAYTKMYYQWLRNELVTIQPDIDPERDVLMGFPVYVKNRTKFTGYLLNNGIKPLIFTGAWGYLPKTLEADFRDTQTFRDNHVLLPLCHQLGKESVNRVIDVVNSYPG